MFQNTMAGGMNLGFPDVCLTPTPIGPIPIPYPNTSTGATFNPATTALTAPSTMESDVACGRSPGDDFARALTHSPSCSKDMA